jgi:hypothetical protein
VDGPAVHDFDGHLHVAGGEEPEAASVAGQGEDRQGSALGILQSVVASGTQEAILTAICRVAVSTASFNEQPAAQTLENLTGPKTCVAELPSAVSPEGEASNHCAPG